MLPCRMKHSTLESNTVEHNFSWKRVTRNIERLSGTHLVFSLLGQNIAQFGVFLYSFRPKKLTDYPYLNKSMFKRLFLSHIFNQSESSICGSGFIV